MGSQGDFYWSDVGRLGSCRAAQRDALSGRVAVEVPGERWGKNLWIAKKARIHPSAYGHIEGFATSAKIPWSVEGRASTGPWRSGAVAG